MSAPPTGLSTKLKQFGQEHVLAFWQELTVEERESLTHQLSALDLAQLAKLYKARDKTYALPKAEAIAPIEVAPFVHGEGKTRAEGDNALRRGEVAVLLVAGGQGSRLGFDDPKGMFPIGPVSGKCLFQLFAEQLQALERRYKHPLPFLVMTSPATDAPTRSYFEQHRFLGLSRNEVSFFQQGTMPALDMTTGKLLMETKSSLFLGPNGHGGTLLALSESGLLDMLRERGIRQVFYFQVDNPLVKIADPLFLGQHRMRKADVSTKVVEKESPTDKLGNLALIHGRCGIIEYSDLPPSLGEQRDEGGRLRYRLGNTAIHIFDVDFLTRVLQGEDRLPFHIARKKVPYLDANGQHVEPTKENALKFEMFIFDALPKAERWCVVETTREEEFAPLKNAQGADSPDAVKQAITTRSLSWLRHAGAAVPAKVDTPVEISPLFALDTESLKGKLTQASDYSAPVYLH